jgi:hypothetical protein
VLDRGDSDTVAVAGGRLDAAVVSVTVVVVVSVVVVIIVLVVFLVFCVEVCLIVRIVVVFRSSWSVVVLAYSSSVLSVSVFEVGISVSIVEVVEFGASVSVVDAGASVSVDCPLSSSGSLLCAGEDEAGVLVSPVLFVQAVTHTAKTTAQRIAISFLSICSVSSFGF